MNYLARIRQNDVFHSKRQVTRYVRFMDFFDEIFLHNILVDYIDDDSLIWYADEMIKDVCYRIDNQIYPYHHKFLC